MSIRKKATAVLYSCYVQVWDGWEGNSSVSIIYVHATRCRYSIADIPGLAVGAHRDYGLGLEFLRHIERSRILVFIIDMSTELGAMEPWLALTALRYELDCYLPELSHRR